MALLRKGIYGPTIDKLKLGTGIKTYPDSAQKLCIENRLQMNKLQQKIPEGKQKLLRAPFQLVAKHSQTYDEFSRNRNHNVRLAKY